MTDRTKRLTTLAISVSVAMILSFVESQIPALIPVPGVKLGLANIATLFVLYKLGWKEAIAVSSVRVALSSLLFGSVSSFLYALAGAALSLAIMALLKLAKIFSTITVSITGAVAHNIAQIGVAMLILQTEVVIYYLPALLISGIITGAVIGIIGALLLNKISIDPR
ncbi:MAG: Gx transporter family protein [Clostridia bacterium]|nr:Gx transporter family protein [Clostridia bacterium]